MPWVPIAGLALSAASTAGSAISSASKASKAKKAERALEESIKNTPKYKPNQSILNYYDKALLKYNTSPTDTAAYKRDSQSIKQGTVQGLSSLNKLRSGDISTIIQSQNNALLNAAVKAENKKAQEFQVLGNATNMKAGQDAKAFQQNEIYPFEAKYNLLSMKAAGNRADQRQSTQNAYNNAMATGSMAMENFGDNNNNGGQQRYNNWQRNGSRWWSRK